MFNNIRLFISKLYTKQNKSIVLGRWSIKHEIEKCDKYMLKMHADPGYIEPYKIKVKNNN